MYPLPSPPSPSHPQRQKLKDVMKTPTSILLSSTIFGDLCIESKKTTTFQDTILPLTLGIKRFIWKQNNRMIILSLILILGGNGARVDEGKVLWRCCFVMVCMSSTC